MASLWLALVSGPAAWLADEGICLLIDANVCSGPLHPVRSGVVVSVFAVVGVVSLLAIAAGAVTARRWLLELDAGADVAIAVERARFLANAALLLGTLTAFGVVLRFVSALASPVCS